MATRQQVRLAHTCAADPRDAVRQLHEQLWRPDTGLVVFFCSSLYDLDAIAGEMSAVFDDDKIVGCTTAGEIGPAGYVEHSISAASFSARSFTMVCDRLDRLQDFDPARAAEFAETLARRLREGASSRGKKNRCGLLLIDGLSLREEKVAHVMQGALGGIPLIGGSAGDDQKFEATWIYHHGRFHRDSALLLLLSTSLPLTVFKTQSVVPTNERMVVTEADPTSRTVTELNGLPAAREYGRLLGIEPDALTPARVAGGAVVIMIGDSAYVRAVQKIVPNDAIRFYCAIENGLVLRLGYETSLIEDLAKAFDRVRADIGPPQLVIGCDCVHRKLAILREGVAGPVGALLSRNNTIGFNTYGEQFGGIHVNQTLTGIAIGQRRKSSHG